MYKVVYASGRRYVGYFDADIVSGICGSVDRLHGFLAATDRRPIPRRPGPQSSVYQTLTYVVCVHSAEIQQRYVDRLTFEPSDHPRTGRRTSSGCCSDDAGHVAADFVDFQRPVRLAWFNLVIH